MVVYIHVPKRKKSKKGTFARYIVSHMDINCKEKKAPKMTKKIPTLQLITLQMIKNS
jgi:hypothetical protein